jgi:hypothetical protein
MAVLKASIRGWMANTRLSRIWFAVCMLMVLSGPKLPAQPAATKEYQIKAVFLFNFAQFVEWPSGAFPEAGSPVVIGVLGEDPFGVCLNETVSGERVNNRSLAVQRYRRVEEIGICHVLFIAGSETDRLEEIFTSLKGRNILTVGDTEGFANRGGMIRFTTEKNKTRLKINLEAAKAARLTLSSKLLKPAEIVSTEKTRS